MDKPADPATPFREVYQHFLAVLRKHGRKESTLAKYLYDCPPQIVLDRTEVMSVRVLVGWASA